MTEEVKKESVKVDTTNPFNIGVSYKDFLENVNAKNSVDDMLNKHKLSEDQKAFIKRELKIIKKK